MGATEPTHLSNEVLEAVPGYLVVAHLQLFGEVCPQDVHAHLEVRLVEVVVDVPAYLPVLASFLHDGMEEREDKDKRGERLVRTLEEGDG